MKIIETAICKIIDKYCKETIRVISFKKCSSYKEMITYKTNTFQKYNILEPSLLIKNLILLEKQMSRTKSSSYGDFVTHFSDYLVWDNYLLTF